MRRAFVLASVACALSSFARGAEPIVLGNAPPLVSAGSVPAPGKSYGFAFAADPETLLVGSGGKAYRAKWTGGKIEPLKTNSRITEFAISPDGTMVASIEPGPRGEEQIRIQPVDAAIPAVTIRLKGRPSSSINHPPLVFSNNGRWLAHTNSGTDATVYEAGTGRAAGAIPGRFLTAIPSPDAKTALVMTDDALTKMNWSLVDLAGRKSIASFSLETAPAYSKDGKQFVAIERAEANAVANVPKKPVPVIPKKPNPNAKPPAPLPPMSFVATYRNVLGKPLDTFPVLGGAIKVGERPIVGITRPLWCVPSPDDVKLCVSDSSANGGGLTIWDRETKAPIAFAPHFEHPTEKRRDLYRFAAFSPDGRYFAAMTSPNAARIGGTPDPVRPADGIGRPNLVGGEIVGGDANAKVWKLPVKAP